MLDYAARLASRSVVRSASYRESVLAEGVGFEDDCVLLFLNHGGYSCYMPYCHVIPVDNFFGRTELRQRRRLGILEPRSFFALIGSFSGRAFSGIRFCGRASYASVSSDPVGFEGGTGLIFIYKAP